MVVKDQQQKKVAAMYLKTTPNLEQCLESLKQVDIPIKLPSVLVLAFTTYIL